MGEGGDERHPDTRERAQGERPHDEGGQGGSVEEGDPRTRVKVTDKRRFRPGESDEPADSTGVPEASEARQYAIGPSARTRRPYAETPSR
jgi:hypothetical protein